MCIRDRGLSIEKIRSTGWAPRMTSAEAIRATALALAKESGRLG